jgi:hypothetical protein
MLSAPIGYLKQNNQNGVIPEEHKTSGLTTTPNAKILASKNAAWATT